MYKSVRENIVIILGYIFKRVLLFTKLRSPLSLFPTFSWRKRRFHQFARRLRCSRRRRSEAPGRRRPARVSAPFREVPWQFLHRFQTVARERRVGIAVETSCRLSFVRSLPVSSSSLSSSSRRKNFVRRSKMSTLERFPTSLHLCYSLERHRKAISMPNAPVLTVS